MLYILKSRTMSSLSYKISHRLLSFILIKKNFVHVFVCVWYLNLCHT